MAIYYDELQRGFCSLDTPRHGSHKFFTVSPQLPLLLRALPHHRVLSQHYPTGRGLFLLHGGHAPGSQR